MIRFRLFMALDYLLMALPRRWRKGFFIVLGRLAHRFAPQRNRIIRQNLSFAFGDTLGKAKEMEIERYCYRNLLLNFLQVMENRRNSREALQSKVTFQNRAAVDAILAQGRGIVFVSAHFGNWELGATALSDCITPTTSIYKGFANAPFDPYLLEARTRHRMEMAEKGGAIKHLAKALKHRQSVSLMIDQASNARHGVAVNFFGHPTYHTSTPALLSYKYDAPIVPLYITSDDEEHFTIRFDEPIEVAGDDAEAVTEATQKQVEGLERVIRERPELWFWCHKRWKEECPELYRKG